MPRYIDAEELLKKQEIIYELAPFGEESVNVVHTYHIVNAPTADVVEVKRGEWKTPTTIGGRAFNVPHCSVCNGIPCGVDENTKYCPNCGAEMKGVE